MDPEHQHRRHRRRRAADGGALRPPARARLEHRRPEAVRRVAHPDGRSASSCCPLGIALADGDGMVAFVWLFWSYVLQSIGELLISPVGYAMIGKLAPRQYQGIMMGAWMLVTGLASLFAGDFSGMIPEPTGTAVATNAVYSKLFASSAAAASRWASCSSC